MGTGSFPRVKSGRGVTLTPHPLQCRGHERVELYLYSPYGPYGLYRASVPVQGCTSLHSIKSCNTFGTILWTQMYVYNFSTTFLLNIFNSDNYSKNIRGTKEILSERNGIKTFMWSHTLLHSDIIPGCRLSIKIRKTYNIEFYENPFSCFRVITRRQTNNTSQLTAEICHHVSFRKLQADLLSLPTSFTEKLLQRSVGGL